MTAILQSRLIGIMQRELEVQNLQLSGYCVQQIEQLVDHGVKRMQLNKAVDHAGHVMQAELNIRALLKYLADYSRENGTFPKLDHASFDRALLTCPTFWPYCSSG